MKGDFHVRFRENVRVKFPCVTRLAVIIKTLTNFTTGLLKTLAYYLGGFILARVTYLIFGWEYIHAPGLHHVIGFLFLLGGAAWLIYSIWLLLVGKKERINYGAVTVHLIAIIAVVGFIAFTVKQENKKSIQTDPSEILIIDTKSPDKSIITNGTGDTVYFKKRDSVLIDKIDIKK